MPLSAVVDACLRCDKDPSPSSFERSGGASEDVSDVLSGNSGPSVIDLDHMHCTSTVDPTQADLPDQPVPEILPASHDDSPVSSGDSTASCPPPPQMMPRRRPKRVLR